MRNQLLPMSRSRLWLHNSQCLQIRNDCILTAKKSITARETLHKLGAPMDGCKQIWNDFPRVRWRGPLAEFCRGTSDLCLRAQAALAPDCSAPVSPPDGAPTQQEKQPSPCSRRMWPSLAVAKESFFFSWSQFDLQDCVSVRCSAKEFGYTYRLFLFLSILIYYKIRFSSLTPQ